MNQPTGVLSTAVLSEESREAVREAERQRLRREAKPGESPFAQWPGAAEWASAEPCTDLLKRINGQIADRTPTNTCEACGHTPAGEPIRELGSNAGVLFALTAVKDALEGARAAHVAAKS